jgi:hypothetical protein
VGGKKLSWAAMMGMKPYKKSTTNEGNTQMSEFEEIFQKGFMVKRKMFAKQPGKVTGPSTRVKVKGKDVGSMADARARGKAKGQPQPPPAFKRSFEEGEEVYCPTCGGEAEVVEKGGKKKLRGKGLAKRVGNEMDPHKGGKTGSFVASKRTGGGEQSPERNHAVKPHAPRSGVVKAMFPMVSKVQLVEYTGLSEDNALAQQIEASHAGQDHTLFTPSQRNLAMASFFLPSDISP